MPDFEYEINGVTYKVTVKELSGEHAMVEVNGVEYVVKLKTLTQQPSSSNPTPSGARAVSASSPVAQSRPMVVRQEPSVERNDKEGHVILAPISGVVLQVKVKPGDEVQAGDVVAVIEAMKMENNITAARDGKVKEVRVSAGSEVQEGEVLIVLS
jgi:biotin carboxyl carrier protein